MFESDWGEQLQGVVCPVVVVVNVKTEECSVVDTSKMGDVSGEWVGRCKGFGGRAETKTFSYATSQLVKHNGYLVRRGVGCLWAGRTLHGSSALSTASAEGVFLRQASVRTYSWMSCHACSPGVPSIMQTSSQESVVSE